MILFTKWWRLFTTWRFSSRWFDSILVLLLIFCNVNLTVFQRFHYKQSDVVPWPKNGTQFVFRSQELMYYWFKLQRVCFVNITQLVYYTVSIIKQIQCHIHRHNISSAQDCQDEPPISNFGFLFDKNYIKFLRRIKFCLSSIVSVDDGFSRGNCPPVNLNFPLDSCGFKNAFSVFMLIMVASFHSDKSQGSWVFMLLRQIKVGN